MTITRRDFLKLSGAALLALSAGNFVPSASNSGFAAPLLWNGSRRLRKIGLSYDDCYLLNRMQDIEQLLLQFPEFRVTYFPIGVKLLDLERQDPGIWRRLVDRGHEIGYHTFNHVNLAVMSPAAALKDFDAWHDALTQVLGREYVCRFVRPPFDVISYTLEVLCQERALVAALFSVGGGGPPETVMKAIRKVQNGDIIQMHIRTDDYHSSQLAYPWFKDNQWQLVTLSAMYDDLLREQNNPDGCDIDVGVSLTRSCLP